MSGDGELMWHYQYYGITGNGRKIDSFRYYTVRELFKTLNRRSDQWTSWEKLYKLLQYNPIAPARIYF